MRNPQAAIEAAIRSKRDLSRLRTLDQQQRGQLIIAACQAAAAIEHAKIQSGLPPSLPAPWPKSTWEFLKKSTSDARSTS
jgi:hypothetical protein